MRRIEGIVLIIIMSFSWVVQAQEMREGPNFPAYPSEKMTALKGGVTLPLRVDNSSHQWFPPVFSQYGWSCNQASSIGYMLTYELNRKRDLDADSLQNQYPPLYVWNFLNSNSASNGVSYFDSWELIKANGCPNYWDFPYWANSSVWMTGYDKYYRSMKNKVINNYSIAVNDANGLRQLKTYVFNHNDNYRYGGLANFQIGSSGLSVHMVPMGTHEGGKSIITKFGNVVGHAMTIIGYDDDVKYDFNGDGLYTNHLDLNDDGEVTLADWEIGALLIVNSWGKDWLDRGKAYVPYRLLTKFGYEGGFWNRSVHVIEVLPDYEPMLTMKLEMVHNSRNMIRISAGVSSDLEATIPDVIHKFPIFNFQGGNVSLGDASSGVHMELGLDMTPLLSYIQSGEPTKFFVLIDENDPSGTATGAVYNYEVIDYTQGLANAAVAAETIPLKDNQTTILSVVNTAVFNKLEMAEYPVQYTTPNNWHTVQLQAIGQQGKTKWEIVHDYTEDSVIRDFPKIQGEIIPRSFGGGSYAEMELPFDFPFYGENYSSIYLDEEGGILLNTEVQDYPYSVDPDLGFKQRKSIIPFGHDLSYFSSSNKMRYYEQDSMATVFWDAMASINGTSTNIRFACNLYPSGLIEFHYSDYNLFGITRASFKSGLSKGDGKEVLMTTASIMGEIEPNLVVKLIPVNTPAKSKIEGNILFCRPEEENQLYEIKLKVSDDNLQEAFGLIRISTQDLSNAEQSALTFPNPFTDQTSISFLVPDDETPVNLVIYDRNGRLVKTLINSEMNIGEHTRVWDGQSDGASSLPEGVYLGRLQIGDQFQTVKLVKTR